jgi:uncharacterized protein YqgV (UPF0045/DUF77 family)
MTISAQVAIYPLRQAHLSPAVDAMRAAFDVQGVAAEVGSMSTTAVGEVDAVFAALRDGFMRATETGHVVMTVTVSNACPVAR